MHKRARDSYRNNLSFRKRAPVANLTAKEYTMMKFMETRWRQINVFSLSLQLPLWKFAVSIAYYSWTHCPGYQRLLPHLPELGGHQRRRGSRTAHCDCATIPCWPPWFRSTAALVTQRRWSRGAGKPRDTRGSREVSHPALPGLVH